MDQRTTMNPSAVAHRMARGASPPAASSSQPRHRLCTIAAKRDLPSARLLAQTFSKQHRDIPITTLVLDAAAGDCTNGLPFDVLTPEDIALDRDTFDRMATYYDARELAAAMKPILLQHLVDAGADAVVYLDPEVEVYAPLDDLFTSAERNIVLTPHITEPAQRDRAGGPDEELFLLRGQFNLGFIGVGKSSGAFLDYLRERTRLRALKDPQRGYFLDQRWVDAAPALFDCAIVRDPTCHVGYWNLHERELNGHGPGTWTVNDRPLRFFQFAEFDPNDPYRLSKDSTGPLGQRVDLHLPLQHLLRDRAHRLLALGWAADRRPYAWDRAPNGMELTRPLRRLYWRAVCEAEQLGSETPPHAFGTHQGLGFSSWLRGPVRPGHVVPRHVFARWQQSPELQAEYPDPLGTDAEALAAWARDDRFAIYTASPALRPDPPVRTAPLPGVNLVGYLDGEFGVGSAARMVARMIRAAGVPLASTMLRTSTHRHRHRYPVTIEGTPFDVTFLAINADELLRYAKTPQYRTHDGTRRVGIWYWEVGVLADWMNFAFEHVDEVWCGSDHVREALASSDRGKLVVKHPLIIESPARPPSLHRADLGLPSGSFLFGYAFDYASVLERKNPLGLIEAYRRAFGTRDGATLVLKTINAQHASHAAAVVREAAHGRSDIVFLDDHLDEVQMRAFFGLIDCFVSLHRSEGLGLTIASAMAAGTPAIATGWSGNLEFMTPENSRLVPYELVEVGPNAYPYPAEALWAEPNLDRAAQSMRDLYDDPAMARELGQHGALSVTSTHDAASAADWFRTRFPLLSVQGT